MMAKRSGKPPRNPAARWLAVVGFTTLGVVLLAVVFGLDGVMDRVAIPLLLACSLMVIVYTAFALASGWIATIGHVGQIYHYRRDKEPILFWLLVVLYLGLAGPTAGYMVSLLLG